MSDAVNKMEVILQSDDRYSEMFWDVIKMLVTRHGVKPPDILYISKLLQEFGWHGQSKITPAQDDIDALNAHLVNRAARHFRKIRAEQEAGIKIVSH